MRAQAPPTVLDRHITSVCDPLGNQSTYGYDTAGRMTSAVSPKGNGVGGNPANYTTVYAYNAFDQVTLVTDPLLHVTQYDAVRV